MDDAMKFMYKMVFKLDVDACQEVTGDANKMEIDLEGKTVHLPEFLKDSVRTVTIDYFSTEEVNKQALEQMKGHYPDALKEFYIELIKAWGLVEHGGSPVGYAVKTMIRNGLSGLVDEKAIREDPKDAYQKGIDKLFGFGPAVISSVKTKYYNSLGLYLTESFLEDNSVRTISKPGHLNPLNWFKPSDPSMN